MAGKVKFAVTAAVIIFLFTFAYARAPLDPTENFFTSLDEATELPESEPKATGTSSTLFLPSEKPEESDVQLHRPESDNSEQKLPENDDKLPEIEAKSTEENTESESVTMPLTVISFRPINHHFPRRPMIPFRHGRPCRHHRHQFKPWGPRFHGRGEFSYGKDMILAGSEDGQIPERFAKVKHGEPRFFFDREEMKKPHHSHHHHHHDEDEERDHDHHHDRDHEHEHDDHHHDRDHEHEHDDHHHDRAHDREDDGGFMRSIRKFLSHF